MRVAGSCQYPLLPAALQALFRPVSMAVPDLALICEIMLMAEGFQESKLLSRKFIILYKLCEDLLSKVRTIPHQNDLRWTAPCQCGDSSTCAACRLFHLKLLRLPPQSRHYDWKLRAIKTTLYVAGSMKRAAPELSGPGWAVGGVLPPAPCVLQARASPAARHPQPC